MRLNFQIKKLINKTTYFSWGHTLYIIIHYWVWYKHFFDMLNFFFNNWRMETVVNCLFRGSAQHSSMKIPKHYNLVAREIIQILSYVHLWFNIKYLLILLMLDPLTLNQISNLVNQDLFSGESTKWLVLICTRLINMPPSICFHDSI